jgi:hypothetical protein
MVVDPVLRYLIDHLRLFDLQKQIANRFRLSRPAASLPFLTTVNPRRPIAAVPQEFNEVRTVGGSIIDHKNS